MNQTDHKSNGDAHAGSIAILHPGVETRQAPAAAQAQPRAAAAPAARGLAPRLDTLRGKRLALFENGKVNALQILVAVGKRLEARHGIAETRVWRKRHAGDTGAAVIPAVLAWKPDLVLTSTGD
jgi:hypothetical protein